MRWTKEQYEEFLNRTHNKKHWSCASNEKLQNADTRKIDNKAGIPEMDGQGCGRFRVSITLYISDKRERDPDGAATTLLDVIIAAHGRLLRMDRAAMRKLATSLKRK